MYVNHPNTVVAARAPPTRSSPPSSLIPRSLPSSRHRTQLRAPQTPLPALFSQVGNNFTQLYGAILISHIEGEKGLGQKASDTVTGSGGDASKEGESYLKQAQDGASNLAGQASDTVNAGVKQAQDALGLNGQFSISSSTPSMC